LVDGPVAEQQADDGDAAADDADADDAEDKAEGTGSGDTSARRPAPTGQFESLKRWWWLAPNVGQRGAGANMAAARAALRAAAGGRAWPWSRGHAGLHTSAALRAAAPKFGEVKRLTSIPAFRAERPKMGHLGFVPTMGNLHAGHVSLVERAKRECETVAASIFINPAQFARGEDLDKYPRTVEEDIEKLKRAGCDYVFMPSVAEMYPSGITLDIPDQQGTFIEVRGKSHQMEGIIRPHFFRGVATIVAKLFNVTTPNVAYFGQKDAQQCVVVRNLVHDLLYDIKIVVGETVREPDGLAMSSRNGYLSPSDREAGLCLYRGLSAAQRLFAQGVRDRARLHAAATDAINAEPRVKLQYVSLAHPRTLEELDTVGPDGAILAGAIQTSSTRLIDNVLLGVPDGL